MTEPLSPLRRTILDELNRFGNAARGRGSRVESAYWGGGNQGPSCAAATSMIMGSAIARLSGDEISFDNLLGSNVRSEGRRVRSYADAVLSDGHHDDYEPVAGHYSAMARDRHALHGRDPRDTYIPRPGDMWTHANVWETGGHVEFITRVEPPVPPETNWNIYTKDNGSLYSNRELRHIVDHSHGDWRIVGGDNMRRNINEVGDRRWVIDTDAFVANGPQRGRDLLHGQPAVGAPPTPAPAPAAPPAVTQASVAPAPVAPHRREVAVTAGDPHSVPTHPHRDPARPPHPAAPTVVADAAPPPPSERARPAPEPAAHAQQVADRSTDNDDGMLNRLSRMCSSTEGQKTVIEALKQAGVACTDTSTAGLIRATHGLPSMLVASLTQPNNAKGGSALG